MTTQLNEYAAGVTVGRKSAELRIAELEAQLQQARKECDMWRNDAMAVCYEAQQAGLYLATHTTADEVMRHVLAQLQQAQGDVREFARLTREQSIRSFVAGAAWWEFEKTNATMWASDKDRAWEAGARKFPFRYVDHREDVDVVEQMREIADRYAAAPTGEGQS